MTLWQKESTSGDACYVDLLSSDEVNRSCYESFKQAYGNVQKNDIDSTEHCKHGDKLSQAENWAEAIEKYNKCIRFACNESETLALGYANRSACFLHLKLYDKCLADIQLAKQANCSEKLLPLLNERETTCLEAIKEPPKVPESFTPELSFKSSEEFPGLANVLDVNESVEFGKHIVAKCDIEVGKIVMLEDVFVFGADLDFETVCKTCAKPNMNFTPCRNCPDVMFCSAACMDANDMHRTVCGALYNRQCRHTLEVESILIAVSCFSNAESLMKFVEIALATRNFASPECTSKSQRKYRFFLKLLALPIDISVVRQQIFNAYQLLSEIPFIQQFFRSEKEKQFLMHLIWQHLCILNTNGFGARHSKFESVYMDTIANLTSMFNHSCVPNTLRINYGNKMIAYVLRPVKKGEQLFISYATGNEHVSSMQKTLVFQCKCSKCVQCWKQEDRNQLKSDQDYLFFQRVQRADCREARKRSFLKGKLENLLGKYGRLPWTREIDLIELFYEKCCMDDLSTWEY